MDYLLGMSSKVRHRIEDGLQAGHVKALDAPLTHQVRGRRFCQGIVSIGDDFNQATNQLRLRNRATFRKLIGTLTYILLAADPCHDPLPKVAAKVQDQIADAVDRLGLTLPNLLLGQLL